MDYNFNVLAQFHCLTAADSLNASEATVLELDERNIQVLVFSSLNILNNNEL